MDVTLVSCVDLPEPDPDERALTDALAAAGISCAVRAWDDPSVDWSAARLSVLRSTWNYPRSPDRFAAWVDRVAVVTELWNPAAVVRWNAHKSYLLDLQRAGIPVTPTTLLRRAADDSLRAVMERNGWADVVVKPAVSASSFRTLRVPEDAVEIGEAHLRALLADRDALVQRYIPAVEDYGERALVWIDGELTHAVRKTVRWDGEDESVSGAVGISAGEAELAREVLRVVEERPDVDGLLYGRVDVAPGLDGSPVVMELELIEPSLFFLQSPSALERFVGAVRRRLAATG